MPTIAEVIAAKKAAAAKAAGAAAWAGEPEDPEIEAMLDRLKPMGKPKAAAIVLSAKAPLPPADVAEKAHHAEQRSLSRNQGEAIPLTPVNADKEVETWHEALNAFESSLCVMRDPKEADVVWLAIRPDREGLPPLLVHRLPVLLWDHPTATYRSEPF
jgi:hypothetical protein